MLFEQIEASVSFDVFYKVMEARNLQIQQQVKLLSTTTKSISPQLTDNLVTMVIFFAGFGNDTYYDWR